MENLSTKQKIMIVSVIVLTLAGAQLPRHLVYSKSISLTHRIFFISLHKNINKNSYVVFMFQHPIVNDNKPISVIKRVACVEGEYLSVRDKNYYCGDDVLGVAKDISLKGEKLNKFIFNGYIPKGKIFVMGDHRDSFDSRYWGFLDIKDVQFTAQPIL